MNALKNFIERLSPFLREQLYGVGGVVRDRIMKDYDKTLLMGDIDLACSLPPQAMRKAFEELGMRVIPTGWKHGTITLLHEDGKYEITSFRSEIGYSDFRHPDEVVFSVTLEEDLSRRDFTINAIAVPLARILDDTWHDCLVDPFGGREDLHHKIIRCVGEPSVRFKEDPLRMLRACRFASQLDFSIDPPTLQAMVTNAQLIKHVSRERIVGEINRLLLATNTKGIELVIETGLLDQMLDSDLLCQNYLKSRPFTVNKQCSLEERWYLLLDWILRAFDAGSCALDINTLLTHFPLSNRERKFIDSLFDSQTLIPTILQDIPPKSDEAMYHLRLRLSQIKQLGLDPICFLRVHSVENPALENLFPIWIEILSTHPPLLVEDLALKPDGLIEFFNIAPGSWIRSVQNFLLDYILRNPNKNTPSSLKSYLRNYKKTPHVPNN
ncbi:MAG: CCA tRNA nucleotidyltransferase [Holophagaceae bacterium]